MEVLNTLMEAAGWTIIHSLWQGAILYTVLMVLLIMNPGLGSGTKHNLSFMALTGMFCWSLITFYTEFERLLPEHYNTGILPLYGAGDSLPLTAETFTHKVEQYIPLLVCIYGIGLAIQIVSLSLGYFKIRTARTTGLSDLPVDLFKRFNELTKKVGITRKVQFYISSKVSVPLMIGYFKPVVLLPLSSITNLETEQLEAIIIHELSHIRRNDYLLNLFKLLIETVLFFNPFVHLTGRNINNERENACDDLVLSITGNSLMYIETLYQLQQLKMEQEQFSMAFTGKNHQLLARMERIMKVKASVVNTRHLALAVFIFLGSIVSISWLNPEIKNGKLTSKNGARMINKLSVMVKSKADAEKNAKDMLVKLMNVVIKKKSEAMLQQDSLSAIKGLYKLGKKPFVLIDGVEYDPGILYKISSKSLRNMSVMPSATAMQRYGDKGKDGAVDITTKSGEIVYMDNAERANIITEQKTELDDFFSRITLQKEDGSPFDRVIVRGSSGGSVMDDVSYKGKVAFLIDGKVYSENDLYKLDKAKLDEIKSSPTRGGGRAGEYDIPGVDLSGYESLFHFTPNPPLKKYVKPQSGIERTNGAHPRGGFVPPQNSTFYTSTTAGSTPMVISYAKKEGAQEKTVEGKRIPAVLTPSVIESMKKFGVDVDEASGEITVRGNRIEKVTVDGVEFQGERLQTDDPDKPIEVKAIPKAPLKEVQILNIRTARQ